MQHVEREPPGGDEGLGSKGGGMSEDDDDTMCFTTTATPFICHWHHWSPTTGWRTTAWRKARDPLGPGRAAVRKNSARHTHLLLLLGRRAAVGAAARAAGGLHRLGIRRPLPL